ncbi:MAG: HpcH/HpaI aldolase/citrate lyase family protein [Solirubrobacteraceae bacterium]
MVTLVVPGSSERMLEKARGIEADEIVIDLEDAVVPERKPEALRAVLAVLRGAAPFQAGKVSVRVNAVGSPWAHTELIALASEPGALDSIVVPKVESAGDVAFVERLLAGAEAAAAKAMPATRATPTRTIKIQALIETAAGVLNIEQITHGADRLEGLILGYADLSVSLGRSPAGRDDLDRWLAIQDTVLVAARAAEIAAIDGPHLVIDDEDGLEKAATRAADLGFDSKWAIHPKQIPTITAAFAPTDAEVAHARHVLEALKDAAADGGGAVKLNGEMLDEPVRLAALRTLARAGEPEVPA